MVKLLIGLKCNESQVLIWKFVEGSNGYKIEILGRLLIIGNQCKMNAWVHLGFTYHFMHLGKLGLFFKVTISLKPEFCQMYLRQNVSKLAY